MRKVGGRLVAVSVDEVKDAAGVVQQGGLAYPILCDTQREVTRLFRVLHTGGGPDGGDIPIPAHFLIDTDGKVVWEHVARRIQDRPHPAEIIKVVHGLPRVGP